MEISAVTTITTPSVNSSQTLPPASREVDVFQQATTANKAALIQQNAALGTPSAIGGHLMSKMREVHQNYRSALGRLEKMLPDEVTQSVHGTEQSHSPFADLDGKPANSEHFGVEDADGFKAYKDMSLDELMATQKSTINDMMSLQYQMGKVSVEEALVSSVAGKATRNLEMLLRGQ